MSDQNMTRRDAVKLGGAALATVGLTSGASATTSAPRTPAPGTEFQAFRGKVVYFYTRTERKSHLLTDPEIMTLGGRLFLTGKIPALGYWTDGLSAAVGWDLVDSYVVYDSVEDYLSRCETYKNEKDTQADRKATGS